MEYMESVKQLEEKMLLNQRKQESNGFIDDRYNGEVCSLDNLFFCFIVVVRKGCYV